MQKDSPPRRHPEGTRPAGAPTGHHSAGVVAEVELWSRGHRPQVGPGRFAYDGLERVIHEKARLGIMTSLVAHPDGLLFVDLKELCALTDGNLNRHLQVLREAGLVEVWKGHRRNRPQTMCRITPQGRSRFLEYVGALEKVVADAAEAAQAHAADRSAKRLLNGFSPA